MKKNLVIIFIAILLGLMVKAPSVKALASYFTIATNGTAGITATSTGMTFMTPGTATTTYNLSGQMGTLLADVDQSYVFVQMKASTTGAILNWQSQVSNDNIDWYNTDNPISTLTVGSAITHASSTNQWQPANALASTTGIAIQFPRVASLYKRLVFTLPIGSANAAIYANDTEYRAPSGQ